MGDRSNVACFNGEKALQVPTLSTEPTLIMSNGIPIPQLAFGMYKIPATDEGETIVGHAIKAGYRHFDSASSYENESTLGRALKKSGIPRENFFICSKVWKDPQIHGRQAARKSVEESLAALDNRDDGYLDLFLIHWPVPGYHVETYKELELLHQEGKIRSLGISNYLPEEYEELLGANIKVKPVVNQFEVSPRMYRPDLIQYFFDRGILVAASKALNRAGDALSVRMIQQIADRHGKTPAQVFLRWGTQKQLVILSKTASTHRMYENRAIFDFTLDASDIALLDSITTQQDIERRAAHELNSKQVQQ